MSPRLVVIILRTRIHVWPTWDVQLSCVDLCNCFPLSVYNPLDFRVEKAIQYYIFGVRFSLSNMPSRKSISSILVRSY